MRLPFCFQINEWYDDLTEEKKALYTAVRTEILATITDNHAWLTANDDLTDYINLLYPLPEPPPDGAAFMTFSLPLLIGSTFVAVLHLFH